LSIIISHIPIVFDNTKLERKLEITIVEL